MPRRRSRVRVAFTAPLTMYSHLVLGGTFDHLHVGHEKLLRTAFSLSKKVMLGLTMPEMNQGKAWSESILSFEERKREVEAFCESLGRLGDLTIIPIHDVYGTTLTNTELEAIVVTPHSYKGAQLINAGRKGHGLAELPIHVCELLTDDAGEVLSSTRIREGRVNRSGFVYDHLFRKTLKINEQVKEYVRKPLGESHFSFPTEWDNVPLFFVGDVVTETAVKMELPISSAWIDGKTQRNMYSFPIPTERLFQETGLTNEPGTINSEVAAFMGQNLLRDRKIYKIDGEEDLLTLVAILLSPLRSLVTYGNPHGEKGVTVVNVTEEKKEEIRSLLQTNLP